VTRGASRIGAYTQRNAAKAAVNNASLAAMPGVEPSQEPDWI